MKRAGAFLARAEESTAVVTQVCYTRAVPRETHPHQVNVRFSDAEYTALVIAARDIRGMTISRFVREGVSEKLERLGRSLEQAAA